MKVLKIKLASAMPTFLSASCPQLHGKNGGKRHRACRVGHGALKKRHGASKKGDGASKKNYRAVSQRRQPSMKNDVAAKKREGIWQLCGAWKNQAHRQRCGLLFYLRSNQSNSWGTGRLRVKLPTSRPIVLAMAHSFLKEGLRWPLSTPPI